MPKKTIGLLISLVIITVILLLAALRTKTPEQAKITIPNDVTPPITATVAHSTLALSPNPVSLDSANKGSVDVIIDTDDNEVTAVQIELEYDPKAITNVQVTTADFFAEPITLINANDKNAGTFTYALGISPAQQPVKGNGVVAKITFNKVATTKLTETELVLLPNSLVTSSGVDDSVLKSTVGTTILLSQ